MTTWLEDEVLTEPRLLRGERFRGRTTIAYSARPGPDNAIVDCVFEGPDRVPGRGGAYAIMVEDGHLPLVRIDGCDVSNGDKGIVGDGYLLRDCHVHDLGDGVFWREGLIHVEGVRDGQGRSSSQFRRFGGLPGDHADAFQGVHGRNVRILNTDVDMEEEGFEGGNACFMLEAYDGPMERITVAGCDLRCANYLGYVWLQPYRYVAGVRVEATWGPPRGIRIVRNRGRGFGKAPLAIWPGSGVIEAGNSWQAA